MPQTITYKKGPGQWLRQRLFIQKLNSPAGYLLMAILSVGLAYSATTDFYLINAGIVGVAVLILLFYICFSKPLIGFYFTSVLSFFVFYPSHIFILEKSFAIVCEVLLYACYIGALFVRHKSPVKPASSFIKSPITIGFILLSCIMLLEIANPNVHSVAGWIHAWRRYLFIIAIYLCAYKLLDTYKKVVQYFNIIIGVSVLAALYGCLQQFYGFLPFEIRYIEADPRLYGLYFQVGEWRKFSFLSDPVSFGMLLAVISLFTFILGIYEKRTKYKIIYLGLTVLMYISMTYSGTRSANIVMPAGIAFYAVLTIQNKKTLLLIIASVLIYLFIMYVPVYSNVTLNRFRSTFSINSNPSMDVRDVNRKGIQPYIYSHPIGGGLTTAGDPGKDYNPGHVLSDFPPDSGLLEAAVEIGWVGLTVLMVFYFLVLFQGIHLYFKARSPEVKKYYLAITVCCFTLILVEYAQSYIRQFPIIFFFFPAIAMLSRLYDFDKDLQTHKTDK
ncbi:MAG: O-antigen ligase family protein [Chitinophagaceae bacterium]|nr:O-antigen ligase family protein [Chitinophagaceae bacterium]